MKKISIVLPVYNAAKYLERCLDSLLEQSYGNFEIVAIDDGSSDGSGEILKRYSETDSRISVYLLGHRNVSAARNFAVKKISGEYVTFIDADDWCEKDYLLDLMIAMEDSKSDLSVCGCTEISGKKVVERYLEDFEPALLDKAGSAESLIAFHSEHNVMSACWSKLYKTEIIRRESIWFSEEATVNADIIFNIEYLLYCNHVKFIRRPLYNYVKYSSSMSSIRDPNAIMTIENVMKGKLAVLEKSNIPPDEIELALLHWKFRALAFSCYREMTSTDRFPFSERIQKTLELAGLVRNMMAAGRIDSRRIQPRTMLFVRFTYLMNRLTVPVLLVPIHLYSIIRKGVKNA